jgi:hypothetical protein
MATDVVTYGTAPASGEEFEYRPLSVAAAASLVFGLLSTMVFVAGRNSFESALMLAPVPIIGLALGLRAISQLRANPDQFTGGKLAVAGTTLSILCLAGGLAFSGYVYATEVPDGYARASFIDMKPDAVELRGDVYIPPDVAALDGKKVFIKGYIRPDSTQYRQNIGQFLLVRDNNQCCFGDISSVKYFDQIAVLMQGDLRVNYHSGLFRLGGTLRVLPQNAREHASGPAYLLEADYAR